MVASDGATTISPAEGRRLPAYIPRQGSFERPTEERWASIDVMPLVEAAVH